jgi:REP element-mobilizing transposase RayT
VHVTLRAAFRSLRSQHVFPTVRGAIADINRRHLRHSTQGSSSQREFRVVHFSVQANHVHLIVEASDAVTLARGVRGLEISLARRVNRLVFRRGRFWEDRWHGRDLTSPRAVRHVLVCVLSNVHKHRTDAQGVIDAFFSAPYFSGFREFPAHPPIDGPNNGDLRGRMLTATAPMAEARTWLLRTGWKRHGLISIFEHAKHGTTPR